jgi:hypothetical protein
MPNFSTNVRPSRETFASGRIQIPGVQSFLIKSERKVIEHCGRLLKNELTSEDRRRLTRLVELVETELQRLDT